MYGAVNSEASGSSSSNFVLVGKNLQQCKLITNNPCALHFKTFNNTWNASVPNSRGLYLDRAVKEFSDFKVLLQLNNYCSHMLYTSLCFYYFPQCSLKRPRISATTCKEVCLETMEACLPVFHALQGQEASIPPHVDCTLLESQEEHINALASLTETDPFNSSHIIHPLVCPNASKLQFDM